MTLTLQLPDPLAAQLQREAKRQGIAPEQLAASFIQRSLPVAERAAALQAMFASWDAEDECNDPNELAARQAEWEQLKKDLNANRTSGRKLFLE